MANNTIHYTLTTSAPDRPKGVLYVIVSYKGTSNGRKSFTINGLNNPNFRYWDKKTKRFSDGTDTAKLNNPVLDEICDLCNELLTNPQISTPTQFVDALKIGRAPKVLTPGGFVSQIIDEMRTLSA